MTAASRARILVVALRRLGDVLLTTPLIRSLKRAYPDAAIDALVFAGTEGILAGNPDLACRHHDAGAAERVRDARAVAQAVAPLRPRALDPGGRPADLVRLGGRPAQRRASSSRKSSPGASSGCALTSSGSRWRRCCIACPRCCASPRRSASRRSPKSSRRRPRRAPGMAPARPYAVVHVAPKFRYKQWTERRLARPRGRPCRARACRGGDRRTGGERTALSRRHLGGAAGGRAARRRALVARACRADARCDGLCRPRHRGDASCGRDRRADRRALRPDRSAPLGPVAGRRRRSALGCGRHDPAARQCLAGAEPAALPAVPAGGLPAPDRQPQPVPGRTPGAPGARGRGCARWRAGARMVARRPERRY